MTTISAIYLASSIYFIVAISHHVTYGKRVG